MQNTSFHHPNCSVDHRRETEEQMNKALVDGALSYTTSNNDKSRTTQIKSLRELTETKNSQKVIHDFSDTGLPNKGVRPPTNGRKKQVIKKQTLEGSQTRHIGPVKITSSAELEEEIITQIPKFQARPLNRKILESKGELGLLCNKKRQVTIPKEFHFAIDKRIPPRIKSNGAELFDKIALSLESHNKKLIPRKTTPRPFHFHTEERGQRKSFRFLKVK